MTEKPRIGVLENAPPWWPDWEGACFSEEELWEIERYSNKIKERITADPSGITPMERWKTTCDLQIPDRPFMGEMVCNLAVANVLDGWSKSLRPGIDLYWYPKLLLKGHFAFVARFDVEFLTPYVMTYGDTEWGGSSRTKIVPYAAPSWVDPPIKTEEDFDRIHVPDVYRDGFYKAYIWIVKKTSELMVKNGIKGLIPLRGDFCGSSAGAGGSMMGMKQYSMDLRRNPARVRRCAELSLKLQIPYGKAVMEAGADTMGACSFGTFMGIEAYKNADINKYDVELVKGVGAKNFFWLMGFDQTPGLEYMCQTGSMPMGWMCTHETPLDLQRAVATKHKKVFGCNTNPLDVVAGPPEKIIEDVKNNIKTGAGPGYWFAFNCVDYWARPDFMDLALKTAKEYGTEVYKNLK